MSNLALEVLKKYWQYDSFRSMQAEIIQSILSGKDTLALLPTGGGKSICFQVPAMCSEGICIVITPLIALMKDQVYQLKKRGIAAQAIFSGMSKTEIDYALDNCIYGKIKFLYVSPERLDTELFIARVKKMNVNLLAIDEAHCISHWGYDFRPSYLHIAALRQYIPDTPVIALTASATTQVIADIQEKLLFTQKNVFKKSFFRSNLSYVVYEEHNKNERLLKILSKIKGSIIIYLRNRKWVEKTSLYLQQNGYSATYYHAGVSIEERSKRQENWIQNKTQIMVATNAFGMGIDKPDVRLVVHLGLPESLEEYYQEAGRAGRDEKQSYAVILFDNKDIEELGNKKSNYNVTIDEIKRVYFALCNFLEIAVHSGADHNYPFDLTTFIKTFNLDLFKTLRILKIIEQEEYILFNENWNVPAKFKVIVQSQELYAYQVGHKEMDKFIKVLLRAFPHLYINYTKLNFTELANYTGLSKEEIHKKFSTLASNNLIDYIPKTDLPMVTFLKNRFHDNDLIFDKNFIEWQQKNYNNRIAGVLEYIENDSHCRNKILLEYYNEIYKDKCGKCDICIKQKNSHDIFEKKSEIIDSLKQKFQNKSFSKAEALYDVSKLNEGLVLEVLRELCDEYVLLKNGEKYIWA